MVRATCENDERFVDALLQLRLEAGSKIVDEPVDATHALPIELLVEFFEPDELTARSEIILRDQPDWLTPEGKLALESLAKLLRERPARKNA